MSDTDFFCINCAWRESADSTCHIEGPRIVEVASRTNNWGGGDGSNTTFTFEGRWPVVPKTGWCANWEPQSARAREFESRQDDADAQQAQDATDVPPVH